MTRNNTIDALDRAVAVRDPAITEVMSMRTGRFMGTEKFIASRRHDTIVRIRNWLREDLGVTPDRLVCAKCQIGVYLVASPLKAFFFRHRSEDGSCPAVTRHFQTEDQIRAAKYAGIQESEAHKRVKRLLIRSISADQNFTVPAEERTWRSLITPGRYRRPDVSCQRGEQWYAFEAQLSTTFISVVAGRRSFYRAEGALLVWVLSHFDPSHRRLIEDDILFPNNSNVLVVDDETVSESEAKQRFIVRCHYRVPNARSPTGGSVWECRLVGFDELTTDFEGQRIFLVDVEGAEREQAQRRRAESLKSAETLKIDFLEFATRTHEDMEPYAERVEAWSGFTNRFSEYGISLPAYYETGNGLDQIIKAIVSAREGTPKGWKFRSVLQIAHHIYESHPRHMLTFRFALQAYGKADLLKAQDTTHKWEPKARNFKLAIAANDQAFMPDLQHLKLLTFLFPEPMARVVQFLERHRTAA